MIELLINLLSPAQECSSSNFSFNINALQNTLVTGIKDIRAVASGGGGGGARGAAGPVGPVETRWARHVKSVNGFVFFRLSYFDYSDLQLFAIFIFDIDFSETYLMTSAENSVSEPPNWKFSGGRIPPDPLSPPPPSYKKKPSFGPDFMQDKSYWY